MAEREGPLFGLALLLLKSELVTGRGCEETACDGGTGPLSELGPGLAATGLEVMSSLEGAGGVCGGSLLQGAARSSGLSHWHGARFGSDGVWPS